MKNDKPSDIKKFLKSSKFSNINFFWKELKSVVWGVLPSTPEGVQVN